MQTIPGGEHTGSPIPVLFGQEMSSLVDLSSLRGGGPVELGVRGSEGGATTPGLFLLMWLICQFTGKKGEESKDHLNMCFMLTLMFYLKNYSLSHLFPPSQLIIT